MARAIPEGRFGQLIDVATKTFVARGYRLTQMADIASALGLAKGTLYGYVESKEALFDAAVRYADGHEPPPSVAELPLRTPEPGATVGYIQQRILKEAGDLLLVQAVAGKHADQNARRELSAILSDLYRRIDRNRFALKMIDRCAAEYPELARVWFGEGRWAQHQLLVSFIEMRAAERRFRRVENPSVVARTILETLAFWAMHRHFDASPQAIEDAEAEAAVIEFLVHGLVRER